MASIKGLDKAVKTIRTEDVEKGISDCFTKEEIDTIEKIIKTNIYNIISDKWILVCVIAIDVCKLDSYIELGLNESLSEYIINKFSKKDEEVFKKAIGKRFTMN